MIDVLGVALASLAALGLAGQAIFVRLGTRRGTSSEALLIVFVVNLVLIGPIALVRAFPDYGLVPRGVLAFLAAGIVGTMLGRALLYAGVERVGASRAEPLKASMPLWATVGAVLFLEEALGPLHAAGVVLVVVGIGLVSWEGARIQSVDAPNVDPDLVGLAFPVAAAVFFGLEPIFAKIGFAAGTPTFVGLAIKVLAALAVFGGYQAVRGRLPDVRGLEWDVARWHLAAGVASSVFLLAYYAALARAPVAVVVPIMQSSPLLVVLLSLAFLQEYERVTKRLVAAAAVVVVGAASVTIFG